MQKYHYSYVGALTVVLLLLGTSSLALPLPPQRRHLGPLLPGTVRQLQPHQPLQPLHSCAHMLLSSLDQLVGAVQAQSPHAHYLGKLLQLISVLEGNSAAKLALTGSTHLREAEVVGQFSHLHPPLDRVVHRHHHCPHHQRAHHHLHHDQRVRLLQPHHTHAPLAVTTRKQGTEVA